MRVLPLASGSRGNALLVEFGPGGLFRPTRLLVDAGLSERELTRRLAASGVRPGEVDALLLSHEHDDHARGAERFSRLHGVPLLCTAGTLEALDRSPQHFAKWLPLVAGRPTEVSGVAVEPFAVPHDAREPLGFVLGGSGRRLGIVTDLGHVTPVVRKHLRGCEFLVVESNHDDRMLLDGPYPWQLKQRVSGRLGHLSNTEAAELVRETADGACRFVLLAHLSEHNNTRRLAQAAVERGLSRRAGRRPEIRVAAPLGPSPPLML